MSKKLDILIDFDGTVCTHSFPKIGKDIGSVPVLKELVNNGHKLILFTMRSDVETPTSVDPEIICERGDFLTQAVDWFKENEIPLYGIQTNPTQHTWTTSPKPYGQLIIDDISLGIPLKIDPLKSTRPFVDWEKVRVLLKDKGLLNDR